MRYFAIIDDKQCGPYQLDELVEAGVRPSTYVWCKGMESWTEARHVADICRYFRQHLAGVTYPVEKEEPVIEKSLPEEELNRNPMAYRLMDQPLPEPDFTIPPKAPLLLALLTTLFCFPLTGFIAIYYCYRTRKEWTEATAPDVGADTRARLQKAAHESSRKARMMIGFTVALGFILMGVMVRYQG